MDRFEHFSRFFQKKLLPCIRDWSNATNINVYIVGGACRDLLTEDIEKHPNDFDFCIESPEGAKPLIDHLSTQFSVATIKEYSDVGTSVILIDDRLLIEIAMTRREIYDGKVRKPSKVEFAPVQEDAFRRDFCCNAVYYNIRTKSLVDPTGKGIHDIKNKKLRSVKNPEDSFREDPLRMLRCLRFFHTLRESGYTIDKETDRCIHWYPEYDQLSLDLIRPELEKLIESNSIDEHSEKKGSTMIRTLHERGLLKHIIPELEEAWGFNQNSLHHSMNLTDHLLATLDYVQVHSTCLRSLSLIGIDQLILTYAALLHDISKYKSFELKKDHTFSFHGHENLSGDMAEEILLRLGYNKEFVTHVSNIIKCHMYLKQFWDPIAEKYDAPDKITNRIWERLQKTADGYIGEALALIDGDNNTHAPKSCKPNQVEQFICRYESINPGAIKLLKGGIDIVNLEDLLPDGNMIKDALNMTKEDLPAIKQIIHILEDIVPMQHDYLKMSKQDILSLYIEMFNHEYYVMDSGYCIGNFKVLHLFKNNPEEESYKCLNYLKLTDKSTRARICKILDNGKDPRIINEKTIKINSLTFPMIHIQFSLREQVNNSFKLIEEGLKQLSMLPNFNYADVCFREGDVTACVDFGELDKVFII